MDQWLHHSQEEIALGIGLCALLLIYRRLPDQRSTLILGLALSACTLLPMHPDWTPELSALLLLLAAIAHRQSFTLPDWVLGALPSSRLPVFQTARPQPRTEAAVQVTSHPVNGTLQVFHLSRWFEAVLIDPANPPLRDGETVYLIRYDTRQAWVSRVRSGTPVKPPGSHFGRLRWQWQLG
ncbi:hypothetical protein [Salinicola rhizosphaerae]|uniref:DUF4131 domain-containing protein n=1 Tax=Salinicola rhizosphaerae TaxID=1443141 RepID=A0ABQ3DWI0_9GAMM|nr:hypothetical protein [Salinicola rhizosphaerae]GHB17761.1 hypothetical protein GCM10009038_15860 [Salinicola rhizosphaerae]